MGAMEATSLEFSVLIAAALAYAVLAEFLGLHWILGAFMAGLFFDQSRLKECNYIYLPLRSEFTMASEGCTDFTPTSDLEPPSESSSPQNGLAAKTYC